MQKPPFQFGLRRIFAVVTGIAVLLAIGITFPELNVLLAALVIGIVALAFPAALSLGVVFCGIVCIRLTIRLIDSIANKVRRA